MSSENDTENRPFLYISIKFTAEILMVGVEKSHTRISTNTFLIIFSKQFSIILLYDELILCTHCNVFYSYSLSQLPWLQNKQLQYQKYTFLPRSHSSPLYHHTLIVTATTSHDLHNHDKIIIMFAYKLQELFHFNYLSTFNIYTPCNSKHINSHSKKLILILLIKQW